MKGKILLVEDNYLNQKVFKIMFEDVGCEVDIASNGAEALTKLAGDYDIVIMDVGLPDMTGIEVTQAYRRTEPKHKHTIILALTGHNLDKDQDRCVEAGMDGYLVKPLMRADMLVLLEKWLKKPGLDSASGMR
jgi:CheY-like chemotaxis protein